MFHFAMCESGLPSQKDKAAKTVSIEKGVLWTGVRGSELLSEAVQGDS